MLDSGCPFLEEIGTADGTGFLSWILFALASQNVFVHILTCL